MSDKYTCTYNGIHSLSGTSRPEPIQYSWATEVVELLCYINNKLVFKFGDVEFYLETQAGTPTIKGLLS